MHDARDRADRSPRRSPTDHGRPALTPAEGAAVRGPEPPRELDGDPSERRAFTLDDIEWFACVSGKAAGGTGGYGLGMMDAVHFARGDEPERPRYEALLPRGRFLHLFDDELRALLRAAVRIVVSGAEPPGERR